MPRARPVYVAFDTETTGLQVGSRLVELAAIAFSSRGRVVSRFATLVDPDMPIPEDATAVHGIDDTMVADAPYVAQAMRDFCAWLPPEIPLIAHNAQYDCHILSLAFSQAGIAVPGRAIFDTCHMARYLNETHNNQLQTLVAAYGIGTSGPAHRAMADAEAVMGYYVAAGHRADCRPSKWRPTWRHPARLPSSMAGLPQALSTGSPWRCQYRNAQGGLSHPSIIPYGFARHKGQILLHGMHTYWRQIRSFCGDRIIATG